MARKSAKIAVTYVVTILMTLLIIGGIGYLLLQNILDPKEEDKKRPSIEPIADISSEEYVPSADDSKTALFIFDSEKRLSGCCFLIVRMSADERRLILMPVPANTYAEADGTSDSIYEFYRTGGTANAVKAIETLMNIKIDHYMKLDDKSFGVMIDIFGGVDVDIPYNLMYSNQDTGEETIFREGNIFMTSEDLRKLFTYPLYNSGEEYRAKIMGIALTDLINDNVTSGFSENIGDYFSAIINSSVETNYTAYDYAEQSDTMKYIAESQDRIASLVTVTGSNDENSLFVLDESFKAAIPEWLRIGREDGSAPAPVLN